MKVHSRTTGTHQFKTFGSYAMDNGLNFGAGVIFSSGRPLTAFAANPIYESDGEIPEGPRGSGIQTVDDGFRTRTPFEYDVNFHTDYSFAMGGNRRLTLLADIFNLFNSQEARDYDQNTETQPDRPQSRLRCAGSRQPGPPESAVLPAARRALPVLEAASIGSC